MKKQSRFPSVFHGLDTKCATTLLSLGVLFSLCVFSTPACGGVKHMTYNVHHCEGRDGKLDVKRIASVIRAENPDFVGLQELDRRTRRVSGMDQVVELERLTGMHATFAKTIDFNGGDYGIMLLSRTKPIAVDMARIPSSEPRVFLMCEFKDCIVCTTHFPTDSEQFRVKAASIMREALARFTKGKDKPVVVSGDWNSTPSSVTLREIGKFLTLVADTGNDTFNGKPSPGPSKLRVKGRDRHCIDYIAVDAAHASRFTVAGAHVVNEPVASDHEPVVVTLEYK